MTAPSQQRCSGGNRDSTRNPGRQRKEAAKIAARRPASLRNPYAGPRSSTWKPNGPRRHIPRISWTRPRLMARTQPPGGRIMLDVILDGFGALLLFGQAALFLARGR